MAPPTLPFSCCLSTPFIPCVPSIPLPFRCPPNLLTHSVSLVLSPHQLLPPSSPTPLRFVSGDNSASLRCCEDYLRQRGLLHVLALLYKSHGQLEAALEVWMQLGTGRSVDAGRNGVAETIEALSSCVNTVCVRVCVCVFWAVVCSLCV